MPRFVNASDLELDDSHLYSSSGESDSEDELPLSHFHCNENDRALEDAKEEEGSCPSNLASSPQVAAGKHQYIFLFFGISVN